MTRGILYLIYRIALGRFVTLRSMWEVLGAAGVLPAWTDVESTQREKPGSKVEQNTLQKTVGFFVSLLMHVSSSTWFEIWDARSWELLIFHRACVVFNGASSRYIKHIGFLNTALFFTEQNSTRRFRVRSHVRYGLASSIRSHRTRMPLIFD